MVNAAAWNIPRLTIIAATFLVLAACSSSEDGSGTTSVTAPPGPTGPQNLVVTITSPAEFALYNEAEPTLSYTVTEGNNNDPVPISRLSAQLHDITGNYDSQQFTNTRTLTDLTSGSNLPTLIDGLHSLEFRVNDVEGNPRVTVFVAFATAAQQPTVTILSPENGTFTKDQTPPLQYQINHPCFALGSCNEEVTVDGDSTDQRNNQNLEELEPGQHTLIVTYTAQYAGGSTQTAVGTSVFNIHTSAPDVFITEPADESFTTDSTPTLEFNIIDACASSNTCIVKVEVDGQVVSAHQSGDELRDAAGNPLSDRGPNFNGSHNVKVTVTDDDGFTSSTTNQFFVDTTAPIISISQPADGSIINDFTPLVVYSLEELCFEFGMCNETVAVDGVDAPTLRNGMETLPLANGPHSISVSYTDPVGHSTTTVSNFTVDAPPPVITNLLPATETFTNLQQPLILQYTIEEECFTTTGGCGETVTVDGETSSLQNGDELVFQTDGGDDGQHTVTVTYTDPVGNETFLSTTFTVDTQEPMVKISEPAHLSTTNDSTPNLRYSIEEPCFFLNQCQENVLLDGAATDSRNGDELRDSQGNPLNDVNHTVEVRYTDAAGNLGKESVSFDVDTTAPAVTLIVPVPGTINTTSINVFFSQDEEGTTDIYFDPTGACATALNGGDLSGGQCSGLEHSTFIIGLAEVDQTRTISLDNLALGDHALYIVAVDALGNTEIKPIAFSVVDELVPALSVIEPEGTIYGPTTSVPITLTAQDDLTAPAGLEVDLDLETVVFDATTQTWVATGTQPITFDPNAFTVDPDGKYRLAITIQVVPDGDYRISASVADESENLTTAPSPKFSLDTTAPVVDVVAPAGQVFTSTPALQVAVTEASPPELRESRVYLFPGDLRANTAADLQEGLLLDGVLKLNGNSLADGTYTVVVEVTDAVNLTGSDHSTFTVNVVGPFIEIRSPSEGEVIANHNLTVQFRAHDVSKVQIWLRNNRTGTEELVVTREIRPVTNESKTYDELLKVAEDGFYTITVRGFDEGHPTGEASVTFTVDALSPAVAIQVPNADHFYFQTGQTIPVEFEVTNATSVTVTVDGEMVSNYNTQSTATAVHTVSVGPYEQDGAHLVVVSVSDGDTAVTDSANFVVDGTDPLVTITNPEEGGEYDTTSITLLYWVTEANEIGEERVWLDYGDPLEGVTNGSTISDFEPGPHVLQVQVVDKAGNESVIARVAFDIIEGGKPRRKSKCLLRAIQGEFNELEELLRCIEDRNKK